MGASGAQLRQYDSNTTRSRSGVVLDPSRLGGPLGPQMLTRRHSGMPAGVARAALRCALACQKWRPDGPGTTNDAFSGMRRWGNAPSVPFFKVFGAAAPSAKCLKYHACQSKSRFALPGIGVVRRGAGIWFFVRKSLQNPSKIGPGSLRGSVWGHKVGRK